MIFRSVPNQTAMLASPETKSHVVSGMKARIDMAFPATRVLMSSSSRKMRPTHVAVAVIREERTIAIVENSLKDLKVDLFQD